MTKVNHNQGKVNQTSFEEGQFYVITAPNGKDHKLFYLHLAEVINRVGLTKKIWSGICMEDPNLFYEHMTELTVSSLTKVDMEQNMVPSGYTVEKANVEINVLD